MILTVGEMRKRKRKYELRYFVNVTRSKESEVVKSVTKTDVEGRRRNRKTKNRWSDVVDNSVKTAGI